MTPQAAYSTNRGDKVLLADQILDCTKPQLLAVWKELNPDGYEPASRKDFQRLFIERYGDYPAVVFQASTLPLKAGF